MNDVSYLVIDSKYKISGHSCNFTQQLQSTVKITKFIQLLYCSIPNTEYLITTGYNDKFKVIFADAVEKDVTLTSKNYNTTTLSAEILTKVNYASFTPAYSINEYKYIFSASQNFTIKKQDSTNLKKCNDIIGIGNNDIISASNIAKSEKCINFTKPSKLYIHIKNLNNGKFYGSGPSSSFIIPINAGSGEVNVWNSNNSYTNVIFVNNTDLNNIEIKLLRSDNTEWTNNDSETSFIFIFK